MKQPLGGQSMEKASTPVEVGLQSLYFRDGIYHRHQLHPKLLLYPPAAWARLFLFQLFLFFFLISPWHLFASRHEWLPPLTSLHRVWKWDFLNLMNEMCIRPVIRAGRREIKKSKLNCFTNCLRVCACVVCLRLLLFHTSSAPHSHTHAHIIWCL